MTKSTLLGAPPQVGAVATLYSGRIEGEECRRCRSVVAEGTHHPVGRGGVACTRQEAGGACSRQGRDDVQLCGQPASKPPAGLHVHVPGYHALISQSLLGCWADLGGRGQIACGSQRAQG